MKTFEDSDLKKIKNRIIILDIDGTLTNDGSNKLSIAVTKKVKDLSKNNRVILLSNKKNHERNLEVAKLCGIEYLKTELKKPSKKILTLIKNPKEEKILVIGDMFITDELFANRIFAEFLKVKRIRSKNESFLIKLIYNLDDIANRLNV